MNSFIDLSGKWFYDIIIKLAKIKSNVIHYKRDEKKNKAFA